MISRVSGLDQIAGIAGLSSHIIPNALNSSLRIRIRGTVPSVHRAIEAHLRLIPQIAHCSVHTVETIVNAVVQCKGAVTNALLNTTDAILQVIEIELTAQIRTCQCTPDQPDC